MTTIETFKHAGVRLVGLSEAQNGYQTAVESGHAFKYLAEQADLHACCDDWSHFNNFLKQLPNGALCGLVRHLLIEAARWECLCLQVMHSLEKAANLTPTEATEDAPTDPPCPTGVPPSA